MQNTERRQLPRIPVKLTAQLHCHDQKWPVTILEISEEGCGIESPVVCEPGQHAQLHLPLHVADEAFVLMIDIEIMHQFKANKDFIFGVHFQNLSSAYRYALKRFIQHQALFQG